MMSWFRALLPREDHFFDLFDKHSAILVEGASALRALLDGGESVGKHCQSIMELESQADDITREVMQMVRRSFITPFDRGDIKDLIQSMDDAIDTMRKTVKTVILFDQASFEPRMREMGDVVVAAARLTAQAVPLLDKPGRNSARLTQLAEEIVHNEERSDELHDLGLKELYRKVGRSDPMAWLIGSEIYSQLEKVVDRFEDVASEISGIVIENV